MVPIVEKPWLNLTRKKKFAKTFGEISSDPLSIINIRFDSDNEQHFNQCVNHFIATDFASLNDVNIIETISHGPGSLTVKCGSPEECKRLSDSLLATYDATLTIAFAEERHAEIKLCNVGNKYPVAAYIHVLTSQLQSQNHVLKTLNGTCTEISEVSDGTIIFHAIIRFPNASAMQKMLMYRKLKR